MLPGPDKKGSGIANTRMFDAAPAPTRVAPVGIAQPAAGRVSQPPAAITGSTAEVVPRVTVSALSRYYSDELVFFWNNVPRDSRVELYVPSVDVDYNLLLRRLRGAPETVHFLDDHTLLLDVQEVSYIPFLNVFGNRVAGLITVTLPDGVGAGEVYTLDVAQIRPSADMVLGGFRLTVPVRKASGIYAREGRVLQVFEERLKLTPVGSRWYPILKRQVDYLRVRALGLAQEAADDCCGGGGKGDGRKRYRVILERIKVLDPYGPLAHGSGQVAFVAHTWSTGGASANLVLPTSGSYSIANTGSTVLNVNREIFRGVVGSDLTIEIVKAPSGLPGCICHYYRKFTGTPNSWLGAYRPSDESPDPENVGDWQVWYRIERL